MCANCQAVEGSLGGKGKHGVNGETGMMPLMFGLLTAGKHAVIVCWLVTVRDDSLKRVGGSRYHLFNCLKESS